MKVLILAAGTGDRLGTLTNELPKALVKVNGQELIHYQLEFLKDSRITQIGVVCGFQSNRLKAYLNERAPQITLFENPHFEKGSILTLKVGLPFLDNDFLLLNVDHIYPKKLLDHILKQVKGITACCDFDRPLVADDMKVKLDSKRQLKEIHKNLLDYDGGYIGMTYCPKSKLDIYRNGFETVLGKLGEKVSVEMILGELAKNGEPIHIANTSGIRWLEVDTLEDLKKAESEIKNI
ncbi:MAG: hypothetical protein A2W61_02155 [Deltaproteobacteria bacterium RIFCSPLOWO2_01_44_7]|nr:MAG: hypothetical protein A2712_03035 [Deltaproteobacteria bacterium RIFCSPHIGHO2_01_FULL_43_49]OGQ16169.1 MAG: hypothetical protein A3D22_01005 [Deltaproteobacteria bacterium RIFCSPHIGHO2_02_FULL_44_53]OGQ29130.1 MAG: hypothetical protein A3D98_04790 [Deltaproteobacteria bacterium RIFCSPHIGHO2_12_FULL_44_21]OGQ32686.1 MAG: hypothetical protein A2979_08935 [Deltaproteobacteria bacterium RIFCSPLOWO2_01_FULL_45_74]OGQ41438.1 MAG: hypothetical protein A2W61_02155 [Deltaproteobacteria bacterium 